MTKDAPLIRPEIAKVLQQVAFLEAVRELAPGVLKRLMAIGEQWGPVTEGDVLTLFWPQSRAAGLLALLRAWAAPDPPQAEAINAGPEWLLRVAAETLWSWEFVPQWRGRFWALPGASWTESEATLPVVDPTILSLTAIKKAYIERERQLRREGWQYPHPRPALEEHMRLLVRYQVLREPYSELAYSEGRELKSVMRIVKASARLVEIPLCRVRGPGRPRGSPTQKW